MDCVSTENTLISIGKYLGNITSIPLLSDTLPRLILSKKEDCIPTTPEIVGTIMFSLLSVVSIYILFKIVSPTLFSTYVTIVLVLAFFLIPIITALFVKTYRSFMKDSKEEIGLSIVYIIAASLPVLVLLYLSWYMVDFEQTYVKVFVVVFVIVPIMFSIISISYIVSPILILLLGPGVIPFLQNQSYFQYCS
jgi:hypothetical protein